MSPVTTVAILTWRSEETTRNCLRSLLLEGRWTGSTVLIDNGSGTGEGERLAREFGVASVLLHENGGVPAGYNAAIVWARTVGASHVLLANNDLTITDPLLVTRLVALVTGDVAAVGPLVRNENGS